MGHDGTSGPQFLADEERGAIPSLEQDVQKVSIPDKDSSFGQKDEVREDILWVEFFPNDPRIPMNYSRSKKWFITFIACIATFLSAVGASSYALGFASMIPDLECTEFQATVGLSVYPLGFAVTPMFTAAFSEETGRNPVYQWSSLGFMLMFLMIAQAPNIQVLIVGRFLQGAFASTGATMVGGTLADIWSPADRGMPMAWYAFAGYFGLGLSPVMAGWVQMDPELEWKWVQWIEMIASGAFFLLVLCCLFETRSTVVLQKIAKYKRKKTGDKRYKARVDARNLGKLIWISCTRPLKLLLTEPIVASFSLWIGFCWGVMFCLLETIPGVFQTLHNFNIGYTGTVYITLAVGSILGFLTSMYQEKLYKKYSPTRGMEARLYTACFAAFLLPTGMFIYAWCSVPSVHWISLCIGITVYIWGTSILSFSLFAYLADCYGPYASSALAGQSLARNVLGTVFPLFAQQMHRRLSYQWSNTLFGCIAVLMLPIPFVLFYFGPKVRMKSKLAREVAELGA